MPKVKKSGDATALAVEAVYKKIREEMRGDPEKALKAVDAMKEVHRKMNEPGERMLLDYIKELPAIGPKYSNEFGIWTVEGKPVEIPTARAQRIIRDFPGHFAEFKEVKEAKEAKPKPGPKGVSTASMSGPMAKRVK